MLHIETVHLDPEALYREAARVALAHRGRSEPHELADLLYATWYARAGVATASVPAGFPSDLVAVLRAAHGASQRWEEGWIVQRVGPAAMVAVARAGEHRLLYRSDYVAAARPGLQARIGDQVLATSRRDEVDPDGSWWRTRGRSWSDATPPLDLIRLYWSVQLAQLPRLVGLLTELLDQVEDPWMLKCAVDPAVHARADSVVLYLSREQVESLTDEIDAIRSGIQSNARATRPPFALAVGPGLAVAEDPGTGESFGQHRCRLVAEAVIEGGGDLARVTAAVVARFSADGIDPDRPHARGPRMLPWERRP